MKENLNVILLDLISKMNTVYTSIIMDELFMDDTTQRLIALNGKLVDYTNEPAVLESSITEQLEFLRPLFSKFAPVKLEISQTISALPLEDFEKMAFDLYVNEVEILGNFMELIGQRINKKMELTDLKERRSNLRLMDRDELVN